MPAQKSAPTTQTDRPVASTQRAKDANRVTGIREFVGTSSFQDPKLIDHAKDLAKSRAVQKYEQYMKSLSFEGKAFDCSAKGQSVVNGNATYYTITATFA